MSKLIDAGREVLGTCREAKENYDFDQLVATYDQHTAEKLIEPQLQAAGLSLGEFRTYKKVKKAVQNGALDVSAARDEAKKAATKALVNEGLLPA
ncbi:hypothetical protein [Aeromonas sp. Y318-3]|uniref:hypothetical protein n=1 Tax=Aeromonas sp. Y318-3 TaxID=2990509 RepID=UPI0022DFC12B|nr:hypothetical protein [Aeromonas sp. Y318-3]